MHVEYACEATFLLCISTLIDTVEMSKEEKCATQLWQPLNEGGAEGQEDVQRRLPASC
jgi:hypothetical protein